MKAKKLLLVIWFSFLSLVAFGKGYAQEESPLEKIYTSVDRLFFYQEGIFYLNAYNELALVQFVASDATGLYVVAANFYKCPSCGKWNRDNICMNTQCPLYRK